MPRTLSALAFTLVLLQAGAEAPLAWDQWQHLPGVVDLGVRSDRALVAMAAGRLSLVSPVSGSITPFADGPDGFAGDPSAEPYFVVARPLAVDDAGCSWSADDLFILDLGAPLGVTRVDGAGHASRFASLAGVDTLGGIALDTTGSFGHRLLVTGTHDGNQTSLFAIDCQASVRTITRSAPLVEGGIAVAPATFGAFGGDLVASDENSGQVWAVDPTGTTTLVSTPALPAGGDTGVESETFVPVGFTASSSAAAYLADRGTPDNPFPGTDSVLRMSGRSLGAAGVRDGDLLIATEGGGLTVVIQCADTCTATQVAIGPQGAHIEGHIATAP